jgi:hypothetical protein
VLGVDPDARMAEFARRCGIQVEVSTFETWDSAGREFDAVVAGTAWHWVDPVAGAAKAAQVLWHGGLLAPFHCSTMWPRASARRVRSANRNSGSSPGTAYTRDEWLDQLPCHGQLFVMAPDKLAQPLEGVGAAIDAMDGSFTMPYTTVAVTAVRQPVTSGMRSWRIRALAMLARCRASASWYVVAGSSRNAAPARTSGTRASSRSCRISRILGPL